MRTRKTKHAERLRLMVDCLPYETRLAMLEGLERFEIIAGAYSDRNGGVCPMLAAHRCGGRTDFRSFARTWDRFTGAARARRATERELRTLKAQLEQSVWNEDLRRHEITRVPDRDPSEREPEAQGAPDFSAEAWLVPARGWDEYRQKLEQALEQSGQPPLEIDLVKRRRSPGRSGGPSSPRGSRTPVTAAAGSEPPRRRLPGGSSGRVALRP
jgi:hypothetical protein